MLTLLASLFGGGIGRAISSIVSDITDAKVRLAAETNATRRAEIQADVAKLEAELDASTRLIEGKQRNVFLALPQWVMGMSVALYVFRVFVWDYVLGWGVTGELRGNTWIIATTVLGGYFLLKLAGR